MSETNVLQVQIEGAILKLLQYFHDKWDKEHSLNYTFEECLVAGIQAKRRSKEYSEATENRKRFERAIAADPTVVTRPLDMIKLCRKYGIGATSDAFVQKVGEIEEEISTAPTPAPPTPEQPKAEPAKAA